MIARLTVCRGSKTKQLDLCLPTIIGRGGESKIKLPASTVSRQHCEIYEYEGQIAIRDLGSSNGTVVNGQRIDGPTFISAEDEVTVGPVAFLISQLNATAPVATETSESTKVDAVVPSIQDLPAEASAPTDTIGAPPAGAATNTDGDASVLSYAAPNEDGERSFLGIEPSEGVTEKDDSAPAFEGQKDSADSVEGDDNSLNDFFNNLDG